MAKDRSARRGEVKSQDTTPIEKSVLFGPDHLDEVEANSYRFQPETPSLSSKGVAHPDKHLPDYKDALASVADRYLAKSSKPQTQPAPDPPQSDSQTPDKSSEAPPVSPSPKPQAGRARRLAPGQWVTK